MKKHYFLVLVAIFIPSVAFASWWNPSTWFKSDTTSTSNNQQQLLDRISELEKKVNEIPQTKPQSTTTVPSTATTQVSDNSDKLNIKVDSLTTDNKSLRAKLASLESKYAICQASLTENTNNSVVVTPPAVPAQVPIQTPLTPTQRNKPYDYANYPNVNISDYVKNPSNWRGWGTEILVGQVNDFMAAGDRGVENNYIEITDVSTTASVPPDKMMILVPDDSDYTKIVYDLKKGDMIDVWGIGTPSQQFHTVGSSDSSSSYEPVISVQRIDRCRSTSCATGNTIVVFMKNN